MATATATKSVTVHKSDAEEKSAKDKAAKDKAVEGAQSIAEAVKRVADAAVAEVQKQSPQEQFDFSFTGTPGGAFTIEGEGFGPSGGVTVGGASVKIRSWSTREITGELPADVQSGEVVVHIDDQNTKTGFFKRA